MSLELWEQHNLDMERAFFNGHFSSSRFGPRNLDSNHFDGQFQC
jgi:hypothetical protein